MMQATLIKLSMLTAVVTTALNGPGGATESALHPVCMTQSVERVVTLDWDHLTIDDLERLADAGHPDAIYWEAMRALRQGNDQSAQTLLIRAGQAGSPDAWWRLSDMARRDRQTDKYQAYRACGNAVGQFRRTSDDSKNEVAEKTARR